MRIEPVTTLISPTTHPEVGTNIQGPSLVRVPDWLDEPLGRYYLYFADHKGDHIRLASADEITGPYTVHPPGALRLEESHFLTAAPDVDPGRIAAVVDRYRDALPAALLPDDIESDLLTPHVASPDVHVDDDQRRFVMYFHGLDAFAAQRTRTAFAADGVQFVASADVTVPETYLRVFQHGGSTYGLAMPGQLYRLEADGRFAPGPRLFEPDMRHSGVFVRGDVLEVFWTRVGDAPEAILHSTIDLSAPFERWTDTPPRMVHRPVAAWEGVDLPVAPSRRGAVDEPVHQLRDPYVFVEGDDAYLLYAISGERGIGLARIDW